MNLEPSLAMRKGSEMRKDRMVVMANWLPTPPRRSRMPGVSMSFLFSLPLKAANRLASEAVIRAALVQGSGGGVGVRGGELGWGWVWWVAGVVVRDRVLCLREGVVLDAG